MYVFIVLGNQGRVDEILSKRTQSTYHNFYYKKDGDKYHPRLFTPTKEIDLCGHGTLGATHILFSEGFSSESAINFYTQSGLLRTELSEQQIILRFNIKKSTQTEGHLYKGQRLLDHIKKLKTTLYLKRSTQMCWLFS